MHRLLQVAAIVMLAITAALPAEAETAECGVEYYCTYGCGANFEEPPPPPGEMCPDKPGCYTCGESCQYWGGLGMCMMVFASTVTCEYCDIAE